MPIASGGQIERRSPHSTTRVWIGSPLTACGRNHAMGSEIKSRQSSTSDAVPPPRQLYLTIVCCNFVPSRDELALVAKDIIGSKISRVKQFNLSPHWWSDQPVRRSLVESTLVVVWESRLATRLATLILSPWRLCFFVILFKSLLRGVSF